MLDSLRTLADLALVVFGFGMVILIHELGHFLAARWAGVRVLEFAIGFGPAIFSWRKGLGLRRGSSARELESLRSQEAAGLQRVDLSRISPTEYRLNWVPLGGYVRMLGQDDLDPSSRSGSPDSYTSKPVWKRLVIISAGVAMNIVLAAALFVAVFMIGLPAPTAVIGEVVPGSPAARATVANADASGVSTPGLRPGDRVLAIDGDRVHSFKDVFAGAAMAGRGKPVEIVVLRPGVEREVVLRAAPTESKSTRLLELGVGSAVSNVVATERSPASVELQRKELDRAGLAGVQPGMRLVRAGGRDITHLHEVTQILESSAGAPVELEFASPTGGPGVRVAVAPRPSLQTATSPIPRVGASDSWESPHLLGLAPAVRIGEIAEGSSAHKAGLRTGDVLAQVGSVEWPDVARAVSEIRRRRGSDVAIAVLRDGKTIPLTVPVSEKAGQIGVNLKDTRDQFALVTRPPEQLAPKGGAGERPRPLAAARLDMPPGSIITSIGGEPVSDFASIRAALQRACASAGDEGASVRIAFRLPLGDAFAQGPADDTAWKLTKEDVAELRTLGWESPVPSYLFDLSEDVLRADSPLAALRMGASETRRVVVMTYVTLIRLFEGTVRVEHLKGPVGIAHLGAQIVDHGLIQLLFFLAIISANLAVLNFLPLPIVDGGHVVFLLIEGITRRPVSPGVQNVAMILGLVLLGGMFLIVTFNDLAAIFRG